MLTQNEAQAAYDAAKIRLRAALEAWQDAPTGERQLEAYAAWKRALAAATEANWALVNAVLA